MRFHCVLSAAVALTACVDVPARGEEVALADAGQGWLFDEDGGARRPATRAPLHAPDCGGAAPPVASVGGFDGGVGALVDAAAAHPGTAGEGAVDAPGPSQPGAVLITELMANPQVLGDTAGEWIELYNVDSERPVSLAGCALDDGGSSPRAIQALTIAPGGFVTIARGPAPGFAPGLVLGMSLGNEADSVALVCAGIEVDRVTYATATGFPIVAGASMALDPTLFDAAENDRPQAWCLGQSSYGGGDRGTPGAANPNCFGDGGVD